MKRNGLLSLMLVPACLFAATARANADTVSGVVRTAAGDPAADTVVWLVAPNVDARATGTKAVMDQRDMHFVPHVLPVQVGTTVDFENHDTVVHNVFTPDACAGAFNLGTWGPGGVRSHTFVRECEATILCSLHADMEAWIVVVPTPYFATTGPDGAFSMSGVPHGTYTVKAWSPDQDARASTSVDVQGRTEANLTLG